jgi:hypothetical protein
MVDRRREDAVDEAAARFADTLAESYRIVYEHAAEAQERQGRLAREFSERVLDHLKEQTESGRAASEQLADQARRQQEAGRALTQESVNAYMDFLNSMFSFAQRNTQAAGDPREEAWDEATHPRDFEGRFTQGEDAWKESEHPRDTGGRFTS